MINQHKYLFFQFRLKTNYYLSFYTISPAQKNQISKTIALQKITTILAL